MRTIEQIYSEYKIMPGLQMHQLRVGAVAKTICENFPEPLDTDNVVLTCLLHDMGNILKADLVTFPEFLGPEGFEYWRQVKAEFAEKYGPDEHEASRTIAREIGIPAPALSYLDTIGFVSLDKVLTSGSFERQICSYSDMRVGPHGVLPLEERLTEARKRYAGRNHPIGSDRFDDLADAVRSIEKNIFSQANIRPEDIQDQKIQATIEELQHLQV